MTGRVLTNTEQQLFNYCQNERQAVELAKQIIFASARAIRWAVSSMSIVSTQSGFPAARKACSSLS